MSFLIFINISKATQQLSSLFSISSSACVFLIGKAKWSKWGRGGGVWWGVANKHILQNVGGMLKTFELNRASTSRFTQSISKKLINN